MRHRRGNQNNLPLYSCMMLKILATDYMKQGTKPAAPKSVVQTSPSVIDRDPAFSPVMAID